MPDMIGGPPPVCPWDWKRVKAMLRSGLLKAEHVAHCPFCGRFFERKDGYPRWRKSKNGRRFGTRDCYRAWKQDRKWREQELRELRKWKEA